MTIEEALDEQLFLDWLASKGEDEVVGMSCDAYSCPIATYLREGNHPRVYVSPSVATLFANVLEEVGTAASRHPLPQFFNRVALAVDDFGSFKQVTRSQVDTVVREVCRAGCAVAES